MQVLIEEYRGWDIYFNTVKEIFFCQLDEQVKEKSSYAAAKKHIDDYIKNNANFVPFELMCQYRGRMEVHKFIGIRKDGRFVIETPRGTDQLSGYGEKDYVKINYEAAKQLDEYSEEANMIEQQLKEKRGSIYSKFEAADLKEIKKRYVS